MLKLIASLLRRGPVTIPYPGVAPVLPERYRGRPALAPSRAGADDWSRAAGGPAPLVRIAADGAPRLDLGACLFSPEEARVVPEGAIAYTRDFRMAATSREALLVSGDEAELAHALTGTARRLFGRSLKLRSVVAGSCAGCEAELVALGNVVYDLGRFGIRFVASPRHADGIVVTGAVNTNMRLALEKTWEAVPEPRLVIAVGACAIGGGPFRGSPEVADGVPADLPVDLWVPGCPPHPLTLLDGLVRLLGRLERGER